MASIFVIKKGATLPDFVNTLSTSSGRFHMDGTVEIHCRHQFGDYVEIAGILLDQDDPDLEGRFRVVWTNTIVDALHLGTYYVESWVTQSDASIAIFPTEGEVTYDRIEVQPSISA